MKKLLFFTLTLGIFTNMTFALSLLPKNSYLQYKDNQKEVLILQEILNSDPDTQVTDSGAGSPGAENWYFGALTENAVERFQQKYNLEVSGKVDYKTLRVLNSIVTNGTPTTAPTTSTTPQINTSPTQTQPAIDNSNPYLDNSNSNPYFSDNSSQDASSYINSAPPVPVKTATTTSLSQTILNAILNKYSSLFSGATNPTTPTPQNNSLNQNPYLTPYGNSSANNSNPYLSNSANPYSSSGAPSSAQQNGGFMSTLSNLLGGGSPLGQTQSTQGQQQSGPITMNGANYDGNPGGDLASKFTKLPEGWLSGRTSHFGTEMNGSKDKSYAPYGADWCKAAMSSNVDTCNPSACLVAMPLSAQIYFFGSDQAKQNLAQIRQGTNAQQLAAAGGGAFYKKIGGSPIEIVNTTNNTCTVAPLWDTGPGEKENGNFVIDVTPCIKKTLQDSGTAFISKFRPVPAGKTGCEGYKYIPTLVKTQ